MSQPLKHNNTMYEQKTQEIISTKDKKSTIRTSKSLKPIAQNPNSANIIPKNPFIYELFSQKNVKKWPFKPHFTGWKKPQKEWEKWYYKLVVNHGTTWINAGILDGIHSTMHTVKCNKQLVFSVCEFWCPETNTFVFPWGEATITLEDVMVLAGFPVLGKPVGKEVDVEDGRVVDGLIQAKRIISNDVVSHRAWFKHFTRAVEVEDGEIVEEGELEHVGFLVLWLCRFVFPDLHEGLIKKHVFPMAVSLSRGTPLGIAPVVLANLYRDLTMLVGKVGDSGFSSRKVKVSGLFKIVQLWVCERFPVFAERFAKPVNVGDPRVARWDNVDVKVKLRRVRSALMSGEGFRWRPYADGLKNWDVLPFYDEVEQIIDGVDEFSCEELPSFSRFCHPCTLVGLKCEEKYNPHRVGMQFGFDQDVPAEVIVSDCVFDKVGFRVPSRNCVGGMTRRYCDWWKDSMLCHKEAVSNALKVKVSEEGDARIVEDRRNVAASDSPRLMEVREVTDAPVVTVDLQASDGKQLTKDPSILEEGEIREEPEVSKTVVMNSTEVHAVVNQHTLQNEGEKVDVVSSDLDSVALALTISANVATEKHPEAEITRNRSPCLENKSGEIRPDSLQNKGENMDICCDLVSVPLASRKSAKVATMPIKKRLSSEITRNRSRSLENKTITSVSTEHESSCSYDKDHVPLASRLQTILDVNRTPTPIESHASILNVRNPNRRAEVASSNSDDAVSKITGKSSSSVQTTADTEKVNLEDRVSKLERNVAKLGVFQFGLDFLDEE